MRTRSSWFCLVSVTALLQGCETTYHVGDNHQPIGCQADDACASDTTCDLALGACVRPPPTSNIDILFLIDNSPSMAPKQAALAASIAKLIQKLDLAGSDYHIGIATSDVGTDVAAGSTWGGSVGACDTYAGDDGALQDLACTSRTATTMTARAACSAQCPDPKFVPSDGNHFISKVHGKTNVPVDLQLDPRTGKMVDRGPEDAFKCMALVGDAGCGVEAQLEGAKRALDGHRGSNAGFLRPGSLLAVIFITDEDDCSVQLARRTENNPSTRDCSTPDHNASADCFNLDYRCLARSVDCDEAMNTPGLKQNCKERATSYLEPVQKYVSFLSGLRPRTRLLVSGIWSLPPGNQKGRVEIAYSSGGSTTPFLNRASGAGAACVSPKDPQVFGQVQFRLSAFAQQFKNHSESSICDVDNYATALDQLADAIVAQAGLASSS